MLFGARTIEGVWLWELPVSFLPMMTFGLVLLFITTFMVTSLHFRKLPKALKPVHSVVIGCLLLIAFSSCMLSIIQVTAALDNTVLAHEKNLETNSHVELRVGFFNKYYFNNNYQSLIKAVNDTSLDIFGMAELSEASYQAIKATIDLPYSYYTNCHCHSEMGDPVALFSRYPLSEIRTDSFKDSGIIEAIATIDDTTKVAVIVVHPDAPMTPDLLDRRNAQIRTLDIVLQNYRDHAVILMGDFNLSNWSPTYQHFLIQNPSLKDSARGFGIVSTWGPALFRSMIDHIFVSSNIAVKEFGVMHVEGSDHEMIWSKVGI